MADEGLTELRTPSGKPFRYKGDLDTEIVVYPSDPEGQPQDRFALVITAVEAAMVRGLIAEHGRMRMGASRDNPPKGSLGSFLKDEGLTPQHLSYLIPVLAEKGICRIDREGQAYVVERCGT